MSFKYSDDLQYDARLFIRRNGRETALGGMRIYPEGTPRAGERMKFASTLEESIVEILYYYDGELYAHQTVDEKQNWRAPERIRTRPDAPKNRKITL